MRELAEIATEMDVHYEWTKKYGLLVLAIGDEGYTAHTEPVPEEIEKPSPVYPDAAAAASAQIRILEKENE